MSFNHASDYTIIIANEIMDGHNNITDEDEEEDSNEEEQVTQAATSPATGDNSPILLLVFFLSASFAVLAFEVRKYAKKGKNV